MDDLLETVNRLSARVQGLEQRMATLEGLLQTPVSHPAATNLPANHASAAAEFALPQTAGVFPVIGRAMLGIAGAYLLRAVSEWEVLPQLAIVAIALAYAATWLVWATRARVPNRFVSLTYAITAALILAPMLAELTLRFHILAAPATAILLIAFLIGSVALAWKRGLIGVAWIGVATAVCTSLGLIVLSRNLVPYVSVLLMTVLVSEAAAGYKRWLSLRGLAAPAANVAVWTLIYVFTLSENARVDYVAVDKPVLLAFPSLLFLLYAASVAFRTLWAHERITVFEIIQTTISFALATFSWFCFAGEVGLRVSGVLCWFLAVACYGAAFVCFNRAAMRNYRVYAAWSSALVLAGSFLVLSPACASVLLSGLAVLMAVVGARAHRLMPGYQAFVYLAAAAFASGLLQFVGSSMTGTLPGSPEWPIWIVAACLPVCYIVEARLHHESWNQRVLHMLLILLAVTAMAALLISALAKLIPTAVPLSPSYVAIVRTLVSCAFALGLAFAVRRWQRAELMYTAYCALAFVTAKLLFEDLRTGHSGWIAVSIFVYAVALIIVPRLGRTARQQEDALKTGDDEASSSPPDCIGEAGTSESVNKVPVTL